MEAVWGLSGPQFLVLYAGVVLIAFGIRMAFPRWDETRGLDAPNLLFMVIIAVGLVRLVNGALLDRPVLLLVVEICMAGVLWAIGYANHPSAHGKLFCVLLSILTASLWITSLPNPGDLGAGASIAAITLTPFLFGLAMSSGGGASRGGGGGGPGGSGGDGGGGGGCGGG